MRGRPSAPKTLSTVSLLEIFAKLKIWAHMVLVCACTSDGWFNAEIINCFSSSQHLFPQSDWRNSLSDGTSVTDSMMSMPPSVSVCQR